jgi:TonB family protein
MNGYVAKSAMEAFTCRIATRDSIDSTKVCVKEYKMSGEILSETNYWPYKTRRLHGVSRKFYLTGLMQWQVNYKEGKLDGSAKCFWNNARLKRDDVFKEDQLVSGKCYTRSEQDTTYYPFKTQASFPGGMENLYEYLDKNVKYPKDAEKDKKQGEVLVSFLVDYDGSIREAIVKKSVSPSLDKEALRVITSMPKWIPGEVDGDKIRTRTVLPIVFKQGDFEKGKILIRKAKK